MGRIIGSCGIKCDECPAYLAHRDDDDIRREETAELWSRLYDARIEPGQINCVGCGAVDGVLFQHCSVCEIRKCALARGIATCAECEEYACERLLEFFTMVPDARVQLEALRKQR